MDLKLLAVAAIVLALAVLAPAPVSGQAVAASCTASLVTSFTPCFNVITSSTNGGGGSPTPDCCRSLAAAINTSTSCACLILTGNVPLGIPINRTLAINLPRACNNMSVPLQCRDTSAQIPAPGPVAFAPSMPPLPPTPPESSAQPESPAQTVEPTATPPASQGQTRPLVLPSSAWRGSARVSAMPAFAVLLAVGAMLV